MHYHCEIIMPRVADDQLVQQIQNILEPFREGNDSEDASSYQFWDWHQIGGRWSGAKLQARLDDARVQEFHAELNRRKVTVSGLQFGKQELSPASQIAEVDALWREWFPESGIDVCPLFKHAGESLADDVCPYSRTPLDMKSERVIIAGPSWGDEGKLEATAMYQSDVWNGVNHCETTWDGTIRQAVEWQAKRLEMARPEYAEKRTVKPDWLVVTIDYHS